MNLMAAPTAPKPAFHTEEWQEKVPLSREGSMAAVI